MGDLVSIIIPCYNQGQFVGEAIDSVLANTYQNIEIIVVNDGSTTEVDSYVDPYIARGEVTYIKQYNQGVSVARNNGIRLSQGRYIVCLDGDDILSSDYIETLYNQINQRTNVIVTSPVQHFGDDDQLWAPPTNPQGDHVPGYCIPCAAMFPVSIWQDVGGYDESMREGYEDWEFWAHAWTKGNVFELAYNPRLYYRRWGRTLNVKAAEKHEEIKQYILTKHKGKL